MSSISPNSPSTALVLPPETVAASSAAKRAAEPTDSAVVPDAAPLANGILEAIGLLGLRVPVAGASTSVLLAQTLLNTDQMRGEIDKRRTSLVGNALAGLANQFNTAVLEAAVVQKTAGKKEKEAELKTAVDAGNTLRKSASDNDTAITNKQAEIDAAKTAVANAKTPEAKTAAQNRLKTLEGEMKGLDATKKTLDDQLETNGRTVSDLTKAIATLAEAITELRQKISAAAVALQAVAALFTSQIAADATVEDTQTRVLDLQTEALFDSITELALQAARNGNPLLRADASREDVDDEAAEPPPRPLAVATALQAALADLLRELSAFDPLLLARPPEQTGLDRLRLRV